jgi:hypothetical protein
MMNWKEYGQFQGAIQHLPGGSDENHKKTQSEWLVSRPRTEHE